MNEEKFNWNALWSDHAAMINLIVRTQKSAVLLKGMKKSIKLDKKEKKKAEKIKRDDLLAFVNEVSKIDEELSKRISGKDTKDLILAEFDKRIEELNSIVRENERELDDALRNWNELNPVAYGLLAHYMTLLREIRDTYKKQIANMELNVDYEQKLKAAAESGEFNRKLKYFEQEAEKYLQRARENKTLQERIVAIVEEISNIKKEAVITQKVFESRTEDIYKIIGKIKSFVFGTKKPKEAEKEIELLPEKGGLLRK